MGGRHDVLDWAVSLRRRRGTNRLPPARVAGNPARRPRRPGNFPAPMESLKRHAH
ncbi:hypothetical protein PSNTI_11040 [Stutzerimonas stutzeri]|nr:hypothetical protein AB691_1122 [Stutzerimonas stutzeri]GBC55649.1 hypothetical protein PSNTI_11040 [Stutzerimonas stutzeri]